jgi:hypothetical protein
MKLAVSKAPRQRSVGGGLFVFGALCCFSEKPSKLIKSPRSHRAHREILSRIILCALCVLCGQTACLQFLRSPDYFSLSSYIFPLEVLLTDQILIPEFIETFLIFLKRVFAKHVNKLT